MVNDTDKMYRFAITQNQNAKNQVFSFISCIYYLILNKNIKVIITKRSRQEAFKYN